MKKTFVTLFVVFLAAGCHKTRVTTPESVEKPTTELQNGFPEDLAELNGYLSLSEEHQSKSVGGLFKTVTAFAVFREPAKPLTESFDRLNQTSSAVESNINGINMGVVTSGSLHLAWNHIGASYGGATVVPDSIPLQPKWYVQGNRTFPGFSSVIPRGYPSLVDNILLEDTANTILGYQINVHRFASNFDSVIISLRSLSNNSTFTFRGGSGVHSFMLTSQQVNQLWPFNTSPVDCRVHLFNYSHRMMNGKVYLYENATRLRFKPGLKSSI
jgi:hypothetical protein